MQIVHFNTKYGSYDEAVSRGDGLAIFVFLFKVSCVVYLQLASLLPALTLSLRLGFVKFLIPFLFSR